MNRQELIETISARTGQSMRQVDPTLTVLVRTIQEVVASGDKVALMGFGTFEPKIQEARQARNVSTGEAIHVPATTKPRFKPGVTFKKVVAEGLPR